jgi:heat shock protein HslJ
MEETMNPTRDPRAIARVRALPALTGSLIAAILAAACGSSSPRPTDPEDLVPSGSLPLVDMEWVLTSLRGEPPLGGDILTLVVGDSTAGGSSGCNLWGADAAVTETTLSLEMLHMTARACEDSRLMDQETDYLALLGGTSTYEIDGRELVLETGEGGTLVYRAADDGE